jgi:hypothetical protein
VSVHFIPAGVDVDAVAAVARAHGRPPASILRGDIPALIFIPDLTAGELVRLRDFMRSTLSPIRLDPDTFGVIAADLAVGRDFLGLASPTNAQAVAALQALWRLVLELAPDR